jgi:hypothetical protein
VFYVAAVWVKTYLKQLYRNTVNDALQRVVALIGSLGAG